MWNGYGSHRWVWMFNDGDSRHDFNDGVDSKKIRNINFINMILFKASHTQTICVQTCWFSKNKTMK